MWSTRTFLMVLTCALHKIVLQSKFDTKVCFYCGILQLCVTVLKCFIVYF